MLVVAVVDIGSHAKTGWARQPEAGPITSGRHVDDLCAELVADSNDGHQIALGFEAPLWVPFADDNAKLGKARPGESPAWSSAPGATVLSYGIQQATYVLHRLAFGCHSMPVSTLDPEVLRAGDAHLLVWEAFVSGKAKDRSAAEPHISDSLAAATTFWKRWSAGPVTSDLGEAPAISLAGLALNVSGLETDPLLLRVAPIVVRAPNLTQS